MDIQKEYTGLMEAFNSVYENQEQLDEAMSSYDRNRKRAAQRAEARNEARRRGQTGNVPGVGYVSPRPERSTYRDSAGVERHHSGARMPKNEEFNIQEEERPFPHEKVKAQQKKHTAAGRYGNTIKMGMAVRRAKEAEKKGGSQQDAGKGWYHAKEEVETDLFDYLLEYLVAEGYADTNKAALAIMANMSEEWKQDIVEDIRGAITYNPNTPIGKLKRRIKGSTPEKREARTREYQGNRSDAAGRYGASQHNPYDDNRGDIPSLRGR